MDIRHKNPKDIVIESRDKMNSKIIDIGINLTNRQFEEDREEVIKRAKAEGVSPLIVTGTSVKESKKAVALCKKMPKELFCTVGVHPHDAKTCQDNTIEQLEKLAKEPSVVAIGECGLDYDRNFSEPVIQRKWFEEQICLAERLKMPLFLHERAAFRDFKKIMESHKEICSRSVVHCFTGDGAELQNYLKLGCFIGITGWICDERRGQHLRNLIQMIPLERLMIETDAPYLLPRNMEKKPKDRRNEPAYLSHIALDIAKCLKRDVEEIKIITYENTKRFFNL